MTQGAQSDQATVAKYQKALQDLCDQAQAEGVVLTIETVSLLPLAMGNIAMQPLARPQWWNADKNMQKAA